MKKHWWCFVFTETISGVVKTNSVYLGWECGQYVNIPRINSAKDAAVVGQEAVMLSCSYLGHMTQETMVLGE